jgi:hypothetical protein
LRPQLIDSVFYVFRAFVVVNLAVAVALLVREVWLRPRWYRVVLTALSCFVVVLALLQITTGYYFAFDDGPFIAAITGIMAYVALMVLTLFGKRMASGLNRTVGVIGLAAPVVTVILFPEYLLIGVLILGAGSGTPNFRGRISPSLSYQVSTDGRLFGGRDYQYTLFRNPQRMRFVRKLIASQPIDHCEVPAVSVRLKPEAQSGFVRVTCLQHADGPVFTGEIQLDQPNRVSLTATR